MKLPQITRTCESLYYRQVAVFVRCFIYKDVLRCGAVALLAGMPARLPLRDRFGYLACTIALPKKFQYLDGPVVLGDGHPEEFGAIAQLAEFDLIEALSVIQ